MSQFSPSISGLLTVAVVGLSQVAAAAPDNLLFAVDNPYPLPEALDSRFGAAVGSDGKAFYVGAPLYDYSPSLPDHGIISVYNTTTHTQISEFPQSGPYEANSRTGTAIAANKKQLMYGRPGYPSNGQPDAGAVTLYPQHSYENSQAGDQLGSAVALFKNVGVFGAPGTLLDNGDAHVAQVAETSYVSFKLADRYPLLFQPGDFAGTAVGISKNYVAVGCPGRTVDGQTSAGAVEVFSAKTFDHVATIVNPRPAAGDLFGKALVVGGKLVAIGAPFADRTNGPHKHKDSGSVYQFSVKGTSTTLVREIKARNNSPDGHFGSSMAILGGLMLVGAPDDSEDANGDGSAYLIKFKKGETIRQVSSANPVNGGRFGEGLAILKKGKYVVGAPGERDSNGNVVGRAYLFKK